MPYDGLSRAELTDVCPNLMPSGHMIDRAGMPWVTKEWGLEVQTEVAIEEWRGASLNYTWRLRDALQVTGRAIEDIYQILQFGVGAPPGGDPDDPQRTHRQGFSGEPGDQCGNVDEPDSATLRRAG